MPVVGYPLGYAAYIVSIPLVPKSKADHDNNRGIIDVEFSILKWDDAKAGESSSKTTIQTAVDSHFQNPDTELKVLFKPRVVYRIHAFCTTQKHLRTYSWARAFALHTKMISCHRAIFRSDVVDLALATGIASSDSTQFQAQKRYGDWRDDDHESDEE